MIRRCVLLVAGFGFAIAVAGVTAQDKKDPAKKDDKKLTVDLFASLDDVALQKEAPESQVIVSQKGWDKLVKAWGIKDAPKVDFEKELLIVGTTTGSRLNLSSKLDEKGDLKVLGAATFDLRPGFRYAIKSVSREGVKTINGKELPKE